MTGTIALPRCELGKLLSQLLRVLLSRLDELSLVGLEEGDGRRLGGGDIGLRYEEENETADGAYLASASVSQWKGLQREISLTFFQLAGLRLPLCLINK